MSDDIVTRLRAMLHNDRYVELICREAADQIERLRQERDEAQHEADEKAYRDVAERLRTRSGDTWPDHLWPAAQEVLTLVATEIEEGEL
jgi:hypothetical protein